VIANESLKGHLVGRVTPCAPFSSPWTSLPKRR